MTEAMTFDPAVPASDRPEHYARAFVKELRVMPEAPTPEQGHAPGIHEDTSPSGPEIIIACVGLVMAPKRSHAKATYGIWCPETDEGIAHRCRSQDPQSKERAATLAILEAARRYPKDRPLRMVVLRRRR